MAQLLRHLAADEDGATMVEYALLVAAIGGGLATMASWLDAAIGGKFASVVATVSGVAEQHASMPISITN